MVIRGGVAEVGGIGTGYGGGDVTSEDEESWEAGREVSGHEPGVKFVNGGLNGVVGGEDGFGVVGHGLLAESDTV